MNRTRQEIYQSFNGFFIACHKLKVFKDNPIVYTDFFRKHLRQHWPGYSYD